VSSRTDAPQSVVSSRPSLVRRLKAWQKRTPFNAYWLDNRHLHAAVSALAPHATGTLLDVGVGEGQFDRYFAPYVTRTWGLEYPPVVFGNLNPDLWNHIERVRGIIDIFGDGQVLPVRTASCDTVLSVEVLEHLPNPESCVSEMARVLKPGGKLLFTVPFVQPLHQLPYDFRRYTIHGLADILERNGLKVESITPRGNVATAAGAVLSQYILRHWAAKRRNHDGAVTMHPIRGPLALPFLAAAQLFFAVMERFAKDDALSLGYGVVATRSS
jgi:SAM-dependent methyltransferase